MEMDGGKSKEMLFDLTYTSKDGSSHVIKRITVAQVKSNLETAFNVGDTMVKVVPHVSIEDVDA
jgi:hypothetical protein